ncbi:MAG: DNA mismatch repair endonuclease MutH [Deltaproteobacteria bacterium]|nr:DNA mismatch repair endonuclease MutH [Deltaproteobacteria bacterium]
MDPFTGEPADEVALLRRARAFSGRRLGDIAAMLGVAVPRDTTSGKGWAGQLVERALGATAGSRPEADFAALGVELKTIPVDAAGRPRESTFVTTLELGLPDERRFLTSRLRKKLARVLWVPVEAAPAAPLPERRLGWAHLWSPSDAEEAVLREDFELLVELCESGLGHRATAHVGKALQLRPKGANSRALGWTVDADGEPIRAAPRAFYLRASFTRQLLAGAWLAPG